MKHAYERMAFSPGTHSISPTHSHSHPHRLTHTFLSLSSVLAFCLSYPSVADGFLR